MRMNGIGRRWMEVVNEWESGGRKGDVPPGMEELEPEKDAAKRDYFSPYLSSYFLRPEVRREKKTSWQDTFFFLLIFFSWIDCREYFCHVEDYGRC